MATEKQVWLTSELAGSEYNYKTKQKIQFENLILKQSFVHNKKVHFWGLNESIYLQKNIHFGPGLSALIVVYELTAR